VVSAEVGKEVRLKLTKKPVVPGEPQAMAGGSVEIIGVALVACGLGGTISATCGCEQSTAECTWIGLLNSCGKVSTK